jgi:DNA invertase Pin-like site-specific DNA recombinase
MSGRLFPLNAEAIMPRLALYARVSTTDQHPEVQIDALRQYAHARGLEITGTYVDHGISGAKARRPALDRPVADAKRRHFDALAIVKLDRIARSVHHLTALAAELEALGIDLIVIDQQIDTSTPAGRFLFNTLGAVAELERDLIRERTRAGLAAAKRRGKRLGRPRAIRGSATFTMERLLQKGASLRAVARELKVDPATVSREAKRLRIGIAGA